MAEDIFINLLYKDTILFPILTSLLILWYVTQGTDTHVI